MYPSTFSSGNAAPKASHRPHPLALPDDALIREADVRLCLAVGRTKLHELIASGVFPTPHRLPGSSVRVWRVRQVRAWIAATVPDGASRPASEPTGAAA
jgi:predicted DNA-binding transcriptional regulator AlpA